MQFYVQAIGIGFLLSVIPGPIFFSLLETSITKGIRAALSFNFGVLLSDLIYIVFASIFFLELRSLDSGDHKLLFRFVSGLIFIVYGVFNFFKKVEILSANKGDDNAIQTKHHLLLSLKGFILNFANPFVVFYWLSVMF
ncbi:MAG: LysE family translocator, partial [Bacteroidetes bacterium]|nr:LysE family translocator [Bacteroidota bacterium]